MSRIHSLCPESDCSDWLAAADVFLRQEPDEEEEDEEEDGGDGREDDDDDEPTDDGYSESVLDNETKEYGFLLHATAVA